MLHLKMALDPVVVIIDGVGVHRAVLKPVPINSAWSKTYILTQKSTFYNVRELSYTLKKWPWTMLSAHVTYLTLYGFRSALSLAKQEWLSECTIAS